MKLEEEVGLITDGSFLFNVDITSKSSVLESSHNSFKKSVKTTIKLYKDEKSIVLDFLCLEHWSRCERELFRLDYLSDLSLSNKTGSGMASASYVEFSDGRKMIRGTVRELSGTMPMHVVEVAFRVLNDYYSTQVLTGSPSSYPHWRKGSGIVLDYSELVNLSSMSFRAINYLALNLTDIEPSQYSTNALFRMVKGTFKCSQPKLFLDLISKYTTEQSFAFLRFSCLKNRRSIDEMVTRLHRKSEVKLQKSRVLDTGNISIRA